MQVSSVAQGVSYSPGDVLVTEKQLEGYYSHLQGVMERVGFIEPGEPRNVVRRLRRLYGRAELGENEMNILRGFLTAIDKCLGKKA